MPALGFKKPAFLKQIQQQYNIRKDVDRDKLLTDFVNYINQFDDLKIEEFKTLVDAEFYMELKDRYRDPEERRLWNEIKTTTLPPYSDEYCVQAIQNLQQKIKNYVQRYGKDNSENAAEANTMLADLNDKIGRANSFKQEQADWEALQSQLGNYSRLADYKRRYPQSAHIAELDDLMWNVTKSVMSPVNLSRYLNDWPNGRHAEEARQAASEIAAWDEIKRSGDIFRVKDYMDSHTASALYGDISSVFYQLRDDLMQQFRDNPSDVDKDDLIKYLNTGIFADYELMNAGLMTPESWEKVLIDINAMPDLSIYQIENPNIEAEPDCTDIYLFGTPGTGKTCLLMGLAGADGSTDNNGNTYTLVMNGNGGKYASALAQYVNAGLTPGRTPGNYVTSINGSVHENKKNGVVTHRVNFIEMSGEEFRDRIADNPDNTVSLENIGTGATRLLNNKNRKVFLIIIDCSRDSVRVKRNRTIPDGNGGTRTISIDQYVSQLDIINKFVGLFVQNENKPIMENVDAIHFVVTKADMLGDESVRLERARELLLSKYAGPVQKVKNLCRESGKINASTRYNPHVFAFSLGKFYLGDVFEFNHNETLNIIDAIRSITGGERERSWWDTCRDWLG